MDKAKAYDAVLSMACGAGVQLVAEMLAPMIVVPALNTRFIGITEEEGVWAEKCIGCGTACWLIMPGYALMRYAPRAWLMAPVVVAKKENANLVLVAIVPGF